MNGINQEDTHRIIERVARESYGRLVAYLSANTRDVASAEDALSNALVAALTAWPRDGVPQNPEAWLLTAARHSFIDHVRHRQVAEASEPTLKLLREDSTEMTLSAEFPDERLKLLFVCAHPAIDPAMHTPLMLQAVLGLDAARIAHALSLATLILLTISVALAVARVSIVLLEHSMRRSATGIQITTLTKMMIRLFWAVPAVLIILSAFNVQAWPAMATLGVGGIAVSFALKDTFANVFSGFYVSLAGQLHRGDFIRLDRSTAGFVEGYVMDIHWRITTLLTLDNNMVLIPNSKLAEAIVTNFSQPAAPLSVSIPYGVAYDTDIALLDRVVLEVVKSAIGEVAGLLREPAPVNRLTPGFAESALNFTLSVSVTDVAAQFAVADLLRRRLLARFRQEGIRIPYPTRTLEIHHEPGSPPPAS